MRTTNKLFLLVSLSLIMITVCFSMITLSALDKVCICIVNFLSYSWIASGLNIMLSLYSIVRAKLCKKREQSKYIIISQAILLLAAVTLIIIFAAKLTTVID